MLAELQRLLRSPPAVEVPIVTQQMPESLQFLEPTSVVEALQALEHLAATIQILDDLNEADQDAIDRMFRFIQAHR